MAKKKRKVARRHTARGRGRVGAVRFSSIDITGIALTVAGGVAAKMISDKLATVQGVGKFAPYIPLVAGIALPMFVKSSSIASISTGLVAGGGITALGSSGLGIVGFLNNSIAGIGYPGGYPMLPSAVAGVGAVSKSNFSGSRLSQMNTIAGIGCTQTANGTGAAI